MDGTIYNGGTVFPTTNPFLSLLSELGLGHTFLTNNPSKSVADYLAHLQHMGIQAVQDDMYTSAQATVKHLLAMQPKVKRIFALGTPSMCAEFSGAGFVLVPDSPTEEPDAVVVGFDTTLTYARLCRAAWWIKQGKPFIATNPDRVCPTDQPTVLVDCGSICAALETATGRKPNAMMGKPDPSMLTGILDRHGLQANQLAMVGDRLYTDLEMARRAGAFGVLVLTGETTAAEAQAATNLDLVVSGLSELGEWLRQAKQEAQPA
jgi:HAD superfamily hydrolase (TIGR01450 family)